MKFKNNIKMTLILNVLFFVFIKDKKQVLKSNDSLYNKDDLIFFIT